MWILQSVNPDETALTFRVLPGTLKTMGRAPRADFVVDAALVSRVHCRFTSSDRGHLEIEDLGSTNGTFVNGRKVNKLALSDGDKLTIGRVEFVVNATTNPDSGSPKTTWTS
jgi:pSer/pThr/pTyr-binding forkhead associated (FHA) protein